MGGGAREYKSIMRGKLIGEKVEEGGGKEYKSIMRGKAGEKVEGEGKSTRAV